MIHESPPRGRTAPPLSASLLLLALALVVTGGCTASGAQGTSRSPDRIDRAEIESSSAGNVYLLIEQARPRWLTSRGASSLQQSGGDLPVVYVGTRRHGDLSSLRGFSLDGIESVRFINAANATTRYGGGHAGGVIELTLRR